MSITKTNSVIHWIALSGKIPLENLIACEEALLFGRAKRAARARASERRSRESPVSSRVPLARVLFTISPKWRACSQAKNLMSIKTFSNHVLNAKINWQLIIFYESKKIFVQLEKVIKFFLLRRHIKFCKQNTAMLVVLRENKLRKTSTVHCG